MCFAFTEVKEHRDYTEHIKNVSFENILYVHGYGIHTLMAL